MFSTHLGSTIRPVMALAPRTIVAGTEGNGAAQVGEAIDRKGFNSAVLAVPVSAVLTAEATLIVSVVVETAGTADAATWRPLASIAGEELVGGEGGSTETALLEVDLNLLGADRYIRASVTGTLSAAATDTQALAGVMILGGPVVKPV